MAKKIKKGWKYHLLMAFDIPFRGDYSKHRRLRRLSDRAFDYCFAIDYPPQESEEQYSRGGCYDCPWGNGEGGCTIPGYCNL